MHERTANILSIAVNNNIYNKTLSCTKISGNDNTTNNNPAMEQILLIFNSLKADNNNTNNAIEAINNKFESLQAENVTTREELLARIDSRSRLSSRSTSFKQLALRHAVTLTATIPVVTTPIISSSQHKSAHLQFIHLIYCSHIEIALLISINLEILRLVDILVQGKVFYICCIVKLIIL